MSYHEAADICSSVVFSPIQKPGATDCISWLEPVPRGKMGVESVQLDSLCAMQQ